MQNEVNESFVISGFNIVPMEEVKLFLQEVYYSMAVRTNSENLLEV
ncbi:MAG: hypothetical protein GY790_15480 [Bacteroidetes bacterium]|nr:hypothetical protein [Bacteroidota bacterium]